MTGLDQPQLLHCSAYALQTGLKMHVRLAAISIRLVEEAVWMALQRQQPRGFADVRLGLWLCCPWPEPVALKFSRFCRHAALHTSYVQVGWGTGLWK